MEIQIRRGGNVDNLLLLSIIMLLGICLILFVMNLYTYKLTKNKKVLIVSGVFILFIIQALMVLISESFGGFDFVKEVRVLMFIDLLAVITIYLATVKSS